MKIDKLILAHKEVSDKIVVYWIKQYFNILYEEEEQLDWEWINEDVGSVFCFADYYVDFATVLECINKDIDVEKFHNWYDWCLENHPKYINLQSFIWGAAEVLEKELDRKKKAVKAAEEVLKRAIEEYNSTSA